MKLLLHTCCAPCLSGARIPFEEEGSEITVYWYNPNIHPFKEYEKRLQTLERYLYLDPLPLIIENDYEPIDFIRQQAEASINEGPRKIEGMMNPDQRSKRCGHCYLSRIEKCVLKAKLEGFDAFSTTMLISKHQDHEAIRSFCNDLSMKHGVKFIYKDLRKNWKDSISKSKELSLYRQPYCGCIFSEFERYNQE